MHTLPPSPQNDRTGGYSPDAETRGQRLVSGDHQALWPLGAGFAAATFVAVLICQLPHAHTLSWMKLWARAVAYVVLTALAGVGGVWLGSSFGKTRSGFSSALLSRQIAVALVFLPSIVLLLRQQSLWLMLVAAVAAMVAAASLRRLFPGDDAPTFEDAADGTARPAGAPSQTAPSSDMGIHPLPKSDENPSDMGHPHILSTLYGLPKPGAPRWRVVSASICTQAAVVFALTGNPAIASTLLAGALYFYVWKWSGAGTRRRSHRGGMELLLVVLAILLASMTLVPWLRTHAGATSAAGATREPVDRNPQATRNERESDYVGIVLWPPHEKQKEIVAPVPRSDSTQMGMAKPLVIPFDGAYWYFKPPNRGPGPRAHIARGKQPTEVNVHSTDFTPLRMEAHQILGTPIDLACCREVDVDITNADNRPGPIAIEVILTDSTSRSTQSLGVRQVVSSTDVQISPARQPVKEALQFPVKIPANVRQFDQITVVFLTGIQRSRGGTKVSIQRFRLVP